MTKKAVSAPAAGNPVGPYAQAVTAGDWIFVSAEKGIDPQTGRIAEGGIQGETSQVLRNIEAILEAAGASMQHVVRCVVYLKNMEDFPAMNEAYATVFSENPPARTTIGVASLPLGLNVMIEATAFRIDGV
jgi:2-iminobutanoate/2-iminopropanoate deaminase